MKNIALALGISLLPFPYMPALADSHGPDVERIPSQLLIENFDSDFAFGTVDASIPPLPEAALELIKHFEGWFPTAYDDPVGYCTIGYGHLIALQTCATVDLGGFEGGISRFEGEEILAEDTTGARQAVYELVEVDLTEEQFGALTSFVFNVGRRNFANSTMLQLLNAGGYRQAQREFRRWVYARGERLPGLEIRRSCEAVLFSGSYNAPSNGEFDRGQCIQLDFDGAAGSPIDIISGE